MNITVREVFILLFSTFSVLFSLQNSFISNVLSIECYTTPFTASIVNLSTLSYGWFTALLSFEIRAENPLRIASMIEIWTNSNVSQWTHIHISHICIFDKKRINDVILRHWIEDLILIITTQSFEIDCLRESSNYHWIHFGSED